MRQAIETVYKGPTDHRGSRIIAKAQAGRVTVPYDHGLSIEANHARAAFVLASKYKWTGYWHMGATASGAGYVAVCRGTGEAYAFELTDSNSKLRLK